MVNHEAKANRRFQRAVQVRIRCPGIGFKERRFLVRRRQTYLSSNLGRFISGKIRDKTFNGRLL